MPLYYPADIPSSFLLPFKAVYFVCQVVSFIARKNLLHPVSLAAKIINEELFCEEILSTLLVINEGKHGKSRPQ